MITAWVDGRVVNFNTAAFSVRIECSGVVIEKSFKLPKMTSNQAELKAIEYVLCSIKPAFRKKIVIKSSGNYGSTMLEKGELGYLRLSKKSLNLIDRVRSLADKFEDCSVVESDDEIILKLESLSKSLI